MGTLSVRMYYSVLCPFGVFWATTVPIRPKRIPLGKKILGPLLMISKQYLIWFNRALFRKGEKFASPLDRWFYGNCFCLLWSAPCRHAWELLLLRGYRVIFSSSSRRSHFPLASFTSARLHCYSLGLVHRWKLVRFLPSLLHFSPLLGFLPCFCRTLAHRLMALILLSILSRRTFSSLLLAPELVLFFDPSILSFLPACSSSNRPLSSLSLLCPGFIYLISWYHNHWNASLYYPDSVIYYTSAIWFSINISDRIRSKTEVHV